ncbi:TonB-dependent receptor [Taibaiella chishuiensis]|uniref:Outer membrane receptor protein involved in Fe transport n=1 Tax=Taibaiella chishuiensis TaxID=1434707 RepID=A0A2P8D0M1_9BACT|nr:TonB-dependent receptor [Taibaiella chishuiensis]PSK90763.1 outer membrane receptor protein involved in Fe transport [Taibaiella chishuiensis]
MRFLLSSFLLILWIPASAQKKVTLSGYVKDAASGESLIGSAIYVQEAQTGVSTNVYGFYSVSLPPGSYTVSCSSLGYDTRTQTLNLIESRELNVALEPHTVQAEEVVISDVRADHNVESTQMGVISLTTEQIKKLPVIFGESDILKAIQLLPGVQSAGEGQSGFYVRGGGPDQNLVLLDDAVVYNTGHLFGFFSVFNSDAIKNVTLIKGGMPAQYGGRLSSVVDVSMKEGNNREYHGEGGIGLIASRLTLEGPIVKEKGSFMLSGRRTYVDIITKPFLKGDAKGSGYYFYDANLKANYRLGARDRIYLSGYFGRDVFSFNSSNFKAHVPWGNTTGTLRWNHQFNDKLFVNTTAVYNDYNFQFSGSQNDFDITLASGIRDWNAKTDFDYYTTFNHHIKFGANYTYHTFTPNQVSGKSGTTELQPNNALKKYAHEAGIYLSDEFDIGSFLKVNAGIRYSWFGQVGPYADYRSDGNGNRTDSTLYAPGQLVKSYGGWEPRLNLRFALGANSSLKASVSKTYQYIHLVSNNGSTLPTDIWMPSTLLVQPQKAWQYSLGFFKNFFDNAVETSVEVYYKDMRNQREYRAGYTPTSLRDPELDLVSGTGEAYGAEFFINKTKGRFTGWIGYTLSWTWRQFKELNFGERFPAKYDRRHDISLVGSYELNKKITFSGVFIFGTGNAITLPTGYYFIEQNLIQEYSKINQYRIFPYHRLDLSVIYTPKGNTNKRLKGSWAFSIYNVYSRQNPYIIYVDTEGTLRSGASVKVKQISIFPILPSITYNFKF